MSQAQTLEQMSDEQVWIPVGQHFEHLLSENEALLNVFIKHTSKLPPDRPVKVTLDQAREGLRKIDEIYAGSHKAPDYQGQAEN